MSPRFAALRRPALRWLVAGATVSQIGDGIYTVAIAVAALTAGHGASGLATVSIAMLVPRVIGGLGGGVLADRVSRRRILLGCDVVRAIVVAGLGTVLLAGSPPLWALAALVVPLGAATGLASPAFNAIIPDLVEGDELVQAHAALGGIGPLAQTMIGPALGGVIAAHSAGVALLVDAATFGASALCVALLHPARQHGGGERDLPWAEFRAGLAYVRGTPWLMVNLLCALVLTFAVAGSMTLLPLLITEGYGADVSLLGTVLAAGGAAGGVAAVGAGLLRPPRRPLATSYVAYAMGLTAVAGLGLVSGPAGAVACVAVLFAGTSVGNVYQETVLGTHVPRELQGRVLSLDWVAATATVPISIVAAATAAGAVGIRTTYVAAGTASAVVALVSLTLLLRAGEPGHEAVEVETAAHPVAA